MEQEWTHIQLTGDLRVRHLEAIRAQLLASGVGNLDVDLGGVVEADTATVQLFLSLRKALAATDHALRLSHIPESLQQLISFYGLHDLPGSPEASDG